MGVPVLALFALEYYFFERRWIPAFMFELWAIELVAAYRHEAVRASHRDYLHNVSDRYAPMRTFYARLQEIAQQCDEGREWQGRQVSQIVAGWPRADPSE